MRKFSVTVAYLFVGVVSGFCAGWVLNEAPKVEHTVRSNDKDNQIEELRTRCQEWSHYVWRLENIRRSDVGNNGDFKNE